MTRSDRQRPRVLTKSYVISEYLRILRAWSAIEDITPSSALRNMTGGYQAPIVTVSQ